jgi:NADH dehydrogenase
VGDVAEVAARAVDGELSAGAVYELGGPEVASFRSCMELMLKVIRRKRLLVPLPFGLATMKARVLQMLPGKLLTVDQVELLKADNVVSEAAISEGRTLEALGIEPRAMAAILPSYLERFREHGQYDAHRPLAEG